MSCLAVMFQPSAGAVVLYATVGVLVLLTVLIPVAMVCWIIRRRSLYPPVNDINPPGVPIDIIKASSNEELPYREAPAEDSGYIEVPVFTPDFHPDTRDGSPSTVALSGDDASTNEAVVDAEEVIKDLRVLIVYSQTLSEAQRRDILTNLVQRLNEDYQGIKPLCCHTVPMDRQPSIWLQQEVPKADIVLCVCTEQSLQEWEARMSTMFGTIKMIIEARICKDEEYSNFATILLDASDKKYIPDLLQTNRKFEIDDLDSIVRYITGIPLFVLP